MKWYLLATNAKGTKTLTYDVPDGSVAIGINARCPACHVDGCKVVGITRIGDWSYESGCGFHSMPFPHVYVATVFVSPTESYRAPRIDDEALLVGALYAVLAVTADSVYRPSHEQDAIAAAWRTFHEVTGLWSAADVDALTGRLAP